MEAHTIFPLVLQVGVVSLLTEQVRITHIFKYHEANLRMRTLFIKDVQLLLRRYEEFAVYGAIGPGDSKIR